MPNTRNMDLEKEITEEIVDVTSNRQEKVIDSNSLFITTTTITTLEPVIKTNADLYVNLLFCLPLFNRLPAELILNIAYFITGDDELDYSSIQPTRIMASFSRSNKHFYSLFQPQIRQRKELHVDQLLIAVLQGNEELVAKIAKSDPALFFIKSTVQDIATDLEGNRRIIKNWSPYQAMFGTGDAVMLARVKPDLDAYLKTIKHGRTIAAKQEQEKFPKGFDFPPSIYDFSALEIAIHQDKHLIQTGIPSASTIACLEKFRADFKPGIIEKGHHFNMNDLIKAHDTHDQYMTLWNCKQRDFFSVFVIGFLQRLQTTYYMQNSCHGFINQDKPLVRKVEIENHLPNQHRCIVMFPHEETKSSSQLGKHYYINIYNGTGIELALLKTMEIGMRWFGLRSFVNVICKNSTSELSRLMYTPQKPTFSCCAIT